MYIMVIETCSHSKDISIKIMQVTRLVKIKTGILPLVSLYSCMRSMPHCQGKLHTMICSFHCVMYSSLPFL